MSSLSNNCICITKKVSKIKKKVLVESIRGDVTKDFLFIFLKTTLKRV